jgi:hypothetical protein
VKKRLSRFWLLALLAVSLLSAPRPARAGIAIAGIGSGQPIATLLVFAVGASSAAASVEFFRIGLRENGLRSAGAFLLSVLSGIAGYVILDANDPRTGSLASLSESDAKRSGLTPAEWKAYQDDLPLLNALREEVLTRASRAVRAQPEMRDETAVLLLREEWYSLSEGAVDPLSLIAVRKLSDRVVSRVVR